MPLWQEMPLLLLVAFSLAVLVRTFLLQAFFIPSGSMETTLLVGDRVLVNKIVYDIRQPQRGEVVVFRGTDAWAPEQRETQDGSGAGSRLVRTMSDLVGVGQPGEKDFIKRVIGLPGDTVACCDANGNVTVNGRPIDERQYLPEERNSPRDQPIVPGQCGPRSFTPVTVGPGRVFVMGDHRLVSQDSRCQGTVPIDNIIGRAFLIVWPSARWSDLPVPPALDSVPRALPALTPGAGGAAPSVGGSAAESNGGDSRAPAGAALVIIGPMLAASGATARCQRSRRRPRRTLQQ
jgi:signal peptidase I